MCTLWSTILIRDWGPYACTQVSLASFACSEMPVSVQMMSVCMHRRLHKPSQSTGINKSEINPLLGLAQTGRWSLSNIHSLKLLGSHHLVPGIKLAFPRKHMHYISAEQIFSAMSKVHIINTLHILNQVPGLFHSLGSLHVCRLQASVGTIVLLCLSYIYTSWGKAQNACESIQYPYHPMGNWQHGSTSPTWLQMSTMAVCFRVVL